MFAAVNIPWEMRKDLIAASADMMKDRSVYINQER